MGSFKIKNKNPNLSQTTRKTRQNISNPKLSNKVLALYSWEEDKDFYFQLTGSVLDTKTATVEWTYRNQTESHQFFCRLH